MKKITLIFTALTLTFTTFAQKKTSSYENWMDTIGVRFGLLEHTQFYNGKTVHAIRDTTAKKAIYKKDGSWEIFDMTIEFPEGLMGIYDGFEIVNGRRAIKVKFKVEIKTVENGKLKKTKEDVAIYYSPNGSGRNNVFAGTNTLHGTGGLIGNGMPKDYFMYGGHIYELLESSPLQISNKMLDDLIRAESIRVKN